MSSSPGGISRTLLGMVLAGACYAATAHGQTPEPDDRTRAAARQLAQDGATAFERGQFEQARALLRRAATLYPAPTITLMEARALSKLGRLVEAAERYEDTRRSQLSSDTSNAFEEAVAQASEELRSLRPRIPLLTIVVQNSGEALESLEVRLDGRLVPVALIGVHHPVDPGAHRIVVKRGDKVVSERRLSLPEGKELTVTLDASGQFAETTTPSTGQPPWAWISLGIGAAGLVTGVAAGALMLDKKSKLDDACTPTCPESSQDDLDAFRTARTVSFIGYGVGILGLGVGGTLLLTEDSDETSAGVAPAVGLGHISIRGRF
ncbi:MAG: hypothetical protein R3B13_36610 [Polyangiaceae bacterium]